MSSSNVCAACQKTITLSRSKKCPACNAFYHLVCVNLSASDKNKLNDKWVCPVCRSREPKGDNTNTPIRATSAATTAGNYGVLSVTDSPSLDDAPLTQFSSDSTTGSDPLERLENASGDGTGGNSTEVTNMLCLLRQDLTEVKATLKLFAESFNALNAKLECFNTRLSEVEVKASELCSLKGTVFQLQEQLNLQMQLNIKNEVELMGINESQNENLHHIVMTTATKIGVKVDDSDIDWVSRAGPRKIDATSSSGQTKFPRPIIVKFLRRGKRDEVLNAAKSRRNLFSNDIGFAGPKQKIFINEHLTKFNRMLFRDARLQSREHGYKFCWLVNTTIKIRKEEGMPAVIIRSKEDLVRLLGASKQNQPLDPSTPHLQK